MNEMRLQTAYDDVSSEADSIEDMEERQMYSRTIHSNQKKRKLNEDERLNRCRERNRVHARNTRERKKIQIDLLQMRIQELLDEKIRLMNNEGDTSVANILVSLSKVPNNEKDHDNCGCSSSSGSTSNSHRNDNESIDEIKSEVQREQDDLTSKNYARMCAEKTIEQIRLEVSKILAGQGSDDVEIDFDLIQRDRASCTSQELDKIRRERNRMHAKRTRLKKKKMLQEMEAIVTRLENEIKELQAKQGIYLPEPPKTMVLGDSSSLASSSDRDQRSNNSGSTSLGVTDKAGSGSDTKNCENSAEKDKNEKTYNKNTTPKIVATERSDTKPKSKSKTRRNKQDTLLLGSYKQYYKGRGPNILNAMGALYDSNPNQHDSRDDGQVYSSLTKDHLYQNNREMLALRNSTSNTSGNTINIGISGLPYQFNPQSRHFEIVSSALLNQLQSKPVSATGGHGRSPKQKMPSQNINQTILCKPESGHNSCKIDSYVMNKGAKTMTLTDGCSSETGGSTQREVTSSSSASSSSSSSSSHMYDQVLNSELYRSGVTSTSDHFKLNAFNGDFSPNRGKDSLSHSSSSSAAGYSASGNGSTEMINILLRKRNRAREIDQENQSFESMGLRQWPQSQTCVFPSDRVSGGIAAVQDSRAHSQTQALLDSQVTRQHTQHSQQQQKQNLVYGMHEHDVVRRKDDSSPLCSSLDSCSDRGDD